MKSSKALGNDLFRVFSLKAFVMQPHDSRIDIIKMMKGKTNTARRQHSV